MKVPLLTGGGQERIPPPAKTTLAMVETLSLVINVLPTASMSGIARHMDIHGEVLADFDNKATIFLNMLRTWPHRNQ